METTQIVLDSGALSALAEEVEAVRYAFSQALADGTVVIIPTIVLAESTTGNGSRDARVNRVAKFCTIVGLDEPIARRAAALRFRQPECGVADAVVIATADSVRGSTVLTSDPRDLRMLSAESGISRVVSIRD